MTELKPCPFCHSTKLKIDKKSTFAGYNGFYDRIEQHTYSVMCNICHARGPAVGGKVIVNTYSTLPPWATTTEALINEAIEDWNRREP